MSSPSRGELTALSKPLSWISEATLRRRKRGKRDRRERKRKKKDRRDGRKHPRPPKYISVTWAERRSRSLRRSREQTTTSTTHKSHQVLAGMKLSPARTKYVTYSTCIGVTHRSTPPHDGAHTSNFASTLYNRLFKSGRRYYATSLITWSIMLLLFARIDRHC